MPARTPSTRLPLILGLFLGLLLPLGAQETDPEASSSPDGGVEQIEKVVSEAVERRTVEVSDKVSNWVDGFASARLGDWAVREMSFGLTPARLLAALAILLVATGLSFLLLHLIRKHAGGIRATEGFGWFAMVVSATRKPLVFLLWVYSAYFAFDLLITGLDDGDLRDSLEYNAAIATYAGLVVAFFWFLFRAIRGTQSRLEARAAKSDNRLDNVLVPLIGQALRLLVPFIGLTIIVRAIDSPAGFEWLSSKLLGIFLVVGIACLLLRATKLTTRALLQENDLDAKDNLGARKIYTKVSVIRKIANIIILVVAVASILMMFDSVRQFGTSILASAGIAGIVLGLAAQKTLGNLIAGIQIAISQPIRIDDVVIVEGEWGRIEEITLTYVVVRIWDLRRLVLPINYFIEKPFQNWTRTSADLLGTVFLQVDYTVPVDAVREEFRRILKDHPLWDGKVCVVQVTEAGDRSVELRLLLSTADASSGWDLRCEVRERMLDFLQREYPAALPRVRAELREPGPGPARTPDGDGDTDGDRSPGHEGSAHPGIDSTTD